MKMRYFLFLSKLLFVGMIFLAAINDILNCMEIFSIVLFLFGVVKLVVAFVFIAVFYKNRKF